MAIPPLQNHVLSVSCLEATRLHGPRKLDVKCAFGPSNHITKLNHRQETVCDIQSTFDYIVAELVIQSSK